MSSADIGLRRNFCARDFRQPKGTDFQKQVASPLVISVTSNCTLSEQNVPLGCRESPRTDRFLSPGESREFYGSLALSQYYKNLTMGHPERQRRISPDEAKLFSMCTAERHLLFARIEEVHSGTTSSLHSGCFGRRLPQHDRFQNDPDRSSPAKISVV